VAERIAFECYMGYTCIMTSFVSVAWCWCLALQKRLQAGNIQQLYSHSVIVWLFHRQLATLLVGSYCSTASCKLHLMQLLLVLGFTHHVIHAYCFIMRLLLLTILLLLLPSSSGVPCCCALDLDQVGLAVTLQQQPTVWQRRHRLCRRVPQQACRSISAELIRSN
jgi:hypothetical protein